MRQQEGRKRRMNLKELCGKIGMDKEVQKQVSGIKPDIPEELLKELTEEEKAEKAYHKLLPLCKKEIRGLDMLAYMLYAALNTREKYRKMGIEETVFLKTMSCFSRFVNEYQSSYGVYGFDRGWWTWRQLSMTLFRVGELEYEFKKGEKKIFLHVPSDADIRISLCRTSVEDFHKFTGIFFSEMENWPVVMESWLLSPSLKYLLDKNSKIIQFGDCFQVEAWDKDDTEFLQWVYGRKDVAYQNLPESTTLQKNMKRYLQEGKKVGTATGYLLAFQED